MGCPACPAQSTQGWCSEPSKGVKTKTTETLQGKAGAEPQTGYRIQIRTSCQHGMNQKTKSFSYCRPAQAEAHQALSLERRRMTNPTTKTWARAGEQEIEQCQQWAAVHSKAIRTGACFCPGSCWEAAGAAASLVSICQSEHCFTFDWAEGQAAFQNRFCAALQMLLARHNHTSHVRESFQLGPQLPRKRSSTARTSLCQSRLSAASDAVSRGAQRWREGGPCMISSVRDEASGRWLLPPSHCAPRHIMLKNNECVTVSEFTTSPLCYWSTWFPY